jgi:acetylornithine/succinyldiaminopimelate/putrescine aminotransferase
VYLIDSDGKRYLYFVRRIPVNALGYRDPALRDAMHAAAAGLVHVSNLYSTEPGERLASMLVEKSFAAKAFLCNSGAEANEGAFKFARRWARGRGEAKHEIVALGGSFHGSLFGRLTEKNRTSDHLPFCALRQASPSSADIEDARRVDSGDDCRVDPRANPGQGGSVLDAGFVREVRALTRERYVALIFDEIQCGLGRTGTLFAYEQYDVEPDLLTLAKPIAGGLPMGVVLMTDAIAATIKPGDHGTTFGGGPFVASVANHVVERLSDPALLRHVTQTGAWFGKQLNEIAQRSGRVRAVRGLGFMWGLDVMGSASTVVSQAFEAGLLTCTAGEYTLRLLPPLVATRDDLADGLRILEEIL